MVLNVLLNDFNVYFDCHAGAHKLLIICVLCELGLIELRF